MRNHTFRIGVFALVTIFLGSAFAVKAGDLNPPAGPITSTMKTLVEVEPRIAVNSTNTPGDAYAAYVISQTGSYYLTEDITGVSGKDGIRISADNVTLDLMGYAVVGVSGAYDGIEVDGMVTRIFNGTIFNWPSTAVDGDVFLDLEDLQVYSNGSGGLMAGQASKIHNCLSWGNTGPGIQATDGSIITHSQSLINYGSGGHGFQIGDNCVLIGCYAGGNAGSGISYSITDGNGVVVRDCTAAANGGNAGIYVITGTITGCTTRSNSRGIWAWNKSIISGCNVEYNELHGISVDDKCQVTGNNCSSNGTGGDGAGIYVTGGDNRIENNNFVGNDEGIKVTGTGNIIVKNTASGNTGTGSPSANYDIAASNHYGQIVSNPGAGFTNSNPWANFEY